MILFCDSDEFHLDIRTQYSILYIYIRHMHLCLINKIIFYKTSVGNSGDKLDVILIMTSHESTFYCPFTLQYNN